MSTRPTSPRTRRPSPRAPIDTPPIQYPRHGTFEKLRRFLLIRLLPPPARSAAMEAQELKVKLPNWLSMPSESPHPRASTFAASIHEPTSPKARLT